MKILNIFLVLLVSVKCFSTSPDYSVSEIPGSLLLNSKAVVRNDEMIFEIFAVNKAVLKVKYAITILNDNGIENSRFIQFYNKFLNIRNFKITLFDKSGKEIRNLNKMNLKDYSAIDGYSLFEDSRVKYMNPNYRVVPFTVEYEYEVNFDGLLSYPDWSVYSDYNIAVQRSSFRIITPEGFKFRYLEKNLMNNCTLSEEKHKSIYYWEVMNQPAMLHEPYSPQLGEFTPVVRCAPNNFEIDGHRGNLESWNNFGKWINDLRTGKDGLSAETQVQIRKSISGLDNDRDKIAVLYQYLQNKVRYVSIQIGIGGWQPIAAETVDRLAYGDCKALTNYMKSLLDIAGIKSYYTLVNAGEDAFTIDQNFPSNQFNHAFLCAPVDNDTLWLECTDQKLPFGFSSTFTDDRKALIIDSTKAELVRTRVFPISENKKCRSAYMNMNTNGSVNSDITTNYSGAFYDEIIPVTMIDEIDRKKFIESRLTIPAFTLNRFSHTESRSDKPSVLEKINLTLPQYCSVIGDKIIFNPNPFSVTGKLLFKDHERKSPIIIRRSTEESDTIIFRLPDSLKPEFIPSKKMISSKFGEYSATTSIKDNELIYVRNLKIFKGNYPNTDCGKFVEFFSDVALADESSITLKPGSPN